MIGNASFESLNRAIQRAFPSLRRLPPELFVVGGAIRDVLLGKTPLDVDLVGPDVRPAAAAFADAAGATLVELGRPPLKSFRVTAGGRVYDFTDLVGSSIEDDLRRRDFTLNAIALDPRARRVVDPFGGAADIERRRVRIVQPRNLDDDPLRVVRAVRFAVRLGFSIDEASLAELRRRASDVLRSAPERVTYEMNLILGAAEKGRGAELLRETGLDVSILGPSIGERETSALHRLTAENAAAGWSVLLASRSAAWIAGFAQRWRWSEASRRTVTAAVALYREVASRQEGLGDGDLAVMQFDAGEEASEAAEEVLASFGSSEAAARMRAVREREGMRLFHPEPLLSGGEIGRLTGKPPGPAIGRLKRLLVEAQLRGEVRTKEEAEGLIARLSR